MTFTCWSSLDRAITVCQHRKQTHFLTGIFQVSSYLAHFVKNISSQCIFSGFEESCCRAFELTLLCLCWVRPNLCMNRLMIHSEMCYHIYCILWGQMFMFNVYLSQFFSLSFSLSCILYFVPSFHPHIKAIYHQDQTQCVSQRQADLLVGFFCVCEFYDWGQGPGTQRYISDKVSLWLLPFLALSMPFRAAWPTWIARPHVNGTFDLNSWVPGDVTTLTSCCSDSVGRDIVEKNIDCLVELPSFGDTGSKDVCLLSNTWHFACGAKNA